MSSILPVARGGVRNYRENIYFVRNNAKNNKGVLYSAPYAKKSYEKIVYRSMNVAQISKILNSLLYK